MAYPRRADDSLNKGFSKPEILIMIFSVVFGLVFWLLDAVLDYWYHYEGAFLNILIANIPAHELYVRIAITVMFIALGVIISQIFRKQRLAEQAVLENEKKYKQFFENFTEGFALHEIILDDTGQPVDYRFLAVNAAFLQLTGLQHRSIVGRTVRDLFPGIEQDPANWIQRYGQVALTGISLKIEDFSAVIGKWFLIQAFCPEHGQFAVTFTDITEQKQIHETISRLAKFPEENPNPVLRVDRDSTILYANEASAELLASWGCEVQGILTGSPSQVVSQVLATGESQLDEVLCQDTVYALIFTPVPDSDFVNIYGHDITKRKQVEIQIRKSLERERFLADVIRNAPMAIGIGFPDGRLDVCNTAFLQLTGYTEAELKQIDWNNQLTPKKWRSLEAESLAQIHHAHDTVRYEKEYLHKDGTPIPIELVVTARFKANGDPDYYIGFIDDISERKQNETQTRLMQEAMIDQQRHEKERVQEELAKVRDELIRKTQLAAIGQVSASIAHDLRNPLACVRNATYLLKRRLGSENEKHTKPLDIIDQEVDKADKIITNLLSIARCKPPRKENICLDTLIETIFERFEKHDNIEFDYQCSHHPFMVDADYHQLEQVLLNLVTNAFQAIEDQGRILVTAEHESESDIISVQDTGKGISEQVRDKIFEPLITTKARGTGLGLTICQQIVKSHGGMIVAGNAPDHGTVMQVQLPRKHIETLKTT